MATSEKLQYRKLVNNETFFAPERRLIWYKIFLTVYLSVSQQQLYSTIVIIPRQYFKVFQSLNMRSLHTYFVQFGNYKNTMSSASVKSSVRYSTKMKILSFIFVTTVIASFSAIPEVSARANQKNSGQMLTTSNASPFTVCIDDSDCLKLGKGSDDQHVCFQVYMKIIKHAVFIGIFKHFFYWKLQYWIWIELTLSASIYCMLYTLPVVLSLYTIQRMLLPHTSYYI